MADILNFENVSIAYKPRRGAATRIINDVSFAIPAHGAYGLVGESGCGKSTIALAAMCYLPSGMAVTAGRIQFEGRDLATLNNGALRKLRGNRIAMIYQDPMSSLNPVMTIGAQLMEVPLLHGVSDTATARARALAMLDAVRLADAPAIMRRYPHELSGGQQQRVVIAMALMAEPSLLIMDEPTTGLDVTIEAAILDLVRHLRADFGAAVLFISHNLGAVARVCDTIGVLYTGRLVETGPIAPVFRTPAHPYTRGLLNALPRISADKTRRKLQPIEGVIAPLDRERIGCAFAPRCPHHLAAVCDGNPIELRPVIAGSPHATRCARFEQLPSATDQVADKVSEHDAHAPTMLEVRDLSKVYRMGGIFGSGKGATVRAASNVSFDVRRGQTLAIVGESGSGKSTVAKVLAGLTTGTAGSAPFRGVDLISSPVDRRSLDVRRTIQMVFQNPDSTLNPSHTIEFALRRPLQRLKGLSRKRASIEVHRLMERVRLPAEMLHRYPHQLSGGQRQRVAIARALAGDPEILIADEPVSALDVSVQAAIVNLLDELLQTSSISLVIISHDLALVRHMADWIAVMYLGRVVEYGPADQVLSAPFHPYTEALLASVPSLDPDVAAPEVVLSGAMPSATKPISGCVFASRCPKKIDAICDTTPPVVRQSGEHTIACHLQLFDGDLPAA